MERQAQLDEAADRGAAIYRSRRDGRGNCAPLTPSELAVYDGDQDLVDACLFGFAEVCGENQG